jgi:myo-inositol 2-dehydrogenase / D-chiro-inositol 1-dehydrogenase
MLVPARRSRRDTDTRGGWAPPGQEAGRASHPAGPAMTGEGGLRAGIIGAGWIGQRHAGVLNARDDVQVTAVCDVDRGQAAQAAAASGARVFADWREMLGRGGLDAVWICTPPLAHADPAVAALDAGLPVYLEKPVARSVPDAARIVAAAVRGGAVCAVGYQWRAISLLGELRGALAGRAVGCLVGQSAGGTRSRPWFLSQAAGGGTLLERGSHHIDLARVLAGEVTAVQAAQSAVSLAPRPDDGPPGDIADAVTLLLHFAGGGLGTIVVAWTADSVPARHWVEVTASGAWLRMDLDPAFRLSGVADGQPVAAVAAGPPFERSVDSFVAAARSGDPAGVLCSPADAARTLAVAAAAEQALATGQLTPVPG